MGKEPCKKFGVVFIRSRKVMKLQSSESSVRDATPANVQNISPLVFFTYFVNFMEKEPVSWSF